MIPLDLTHQVLATERVQQRLLTGSRGVLSTDDHSVIRRLFHDLLVFFASTYRDVFGLKIGPPLHDPIAIAVLLEGLGIEFDDQGGERWNVEVVTDGLHSDKDKERGQVGRTVTSKAAAGGVRIPRSLNVARFWETVELCLNLVEESLDSSDSDQ